MAFFFEAGEEVLYLLGLVRLLSYLLLDHGVTVGLVV